VGMSLTDLVYAVVMARVIHIIRHTLIQDNLFADCERDGPRHQATTKHLTMLTWSPQWLGPQRI